MKFVIEPYTTCQRVFLWVYTVRNLPQALQIVWPLSSLLQRGVTVVPQFWHAMTTVVSSTWLWACEDVRSVAWSSATMEDDGPSEGLFDVRQLPDFCPFTLRFALFDRRLLKAGQPWQPSAPPVPLHRPPPGHVPVGVCSAETYVAPGTLARGFGAIETCWPGGLSWTTLGGFFRPMGREVFLALKYKPQALQIVAPCGDLLHRGVRVVPQLLRNG